MKTILHADYWVEIPAGECQIGLTEDQRLLIWRGMRDRAGYAQQPAHEQQRMDAALEKVQRGEKTTQEEAALFGRYEVPTFTELPPRTIWLERFFIARYPITGSQYYLFKQGTPVSDIPGTLDQAETWTPRKGKLVYNRCAAQIATDRHAIEFCRQLGGRLPRSEEWEKAARGPDSYLYPWGNEWDETRGFFYYGQKVRKPCADGKSAVDGYPEGVSPCGVWAMAGDIPELVIVPANPYDSKVTIDGKTVSIALKKYHPRESSGRYADDAHLAARAGVGDWVTFRPVLDEWPPQQWRGVSFEREAT